MKSTTSNRRPHDPPFFKAELIIEHGQIVDIRYSNVRGRRPLGPRPMADFRAVVEEFAEEIVEKWINYFILHKPVPSETITRKIG